jgi:hypothetical protein
MQVMTSRPLKNGSASAPSARIAANNIMHAYADVLRGYRGPRSVPTSLAL